MGTKINKTNDERIDLNLNPKHETKKTKKTKRLKPKHEVCKNKV